ncbi:uncharacterized protein LOC122075525 [Macadamia integrifolia]|uniref:uncharacterized protein LOC122075525 n=1 Tax=Macadamia integrifolia TaxID=60698 RepID=UPI001C4F916C|nr:uncharacterized protein LOC122075525 [Macadamia integrifolia]
MFEGLVRWLLLGFLIQKNPERSTQDQLMERGLHDGRHLFEVCINGSQGAGCASHNWTVDTGKVFGNIWVLHFFGEKLIYLLANGFDVLDDPVESFLRYMIFVRRFVPLPSRNSLSLNIILDFELYGMNLTTLQVIIPLMLKTTAYTKFIDKIRVYDILNVEYDRISVYMLSKSPFPTLE